MSERIDWVKENTNTFLRKLSNGEKIKKMNFAKGGKLKRKKGEYSYAKL